MRVDGGETPPHDAAASKVYSGELMERFGEAALDILGMAGTLDEGSPGGDRALAFAVAGLPGDFQMEFTTRSTVQSLLPFAGGPAPAPGPRRQAHRRVAARPAGLRRSGLRHGSFKWYNRYSPTPTPTEP